MSRYLIVISIIYLCSLSSLYSQSCNLSISGVITDLHDGSPILGALVSIKGTNFFSQTNQDGKYPDFNHCVDSSDPFIFNSSVAALGERLFATIHIDNIPPPFDSVKDGCQW